jgi:hypothetical protein
MSHASTSRRSSGQRRKALARADGSTLLLREVLAYRHGEGKYNFSRLPDEERGIASLEAWESLETRIESHLSNNKAEPRA